MQLNKVLEQHIAVFGESGSGKTVLVSSFYGATQEAQFMKSSLFNVTADDTGQGHRLHGNYLGMKRRAERPEATKFAATPYKFTVKLRDQSAKANSATPFDAVRLVWHDYPGEWFEEDVSGPEEAERRVTTFRSLLRSDVAFLLVDGQRLLDNAGEEERYLKLLLGSFRTGLLRLEDELLEDNQRFVRFPRIWVLALSKADLLPELDVFEFRDLVIEKAAEDLEELRRVLKRFVDSPGALAVGEDFVRFSSAKFEPNKIEVTERIGLDLVLPLASMLPLERYIQWGEQKQLGTKLAEELATGIGTLATALISKTKFEKSKNAVLALVGSKVAMAAIEMGTERLRTMNSDAVAKKDYMAAVLTQFGLDLDRGEEDRVLLRSKK